MNKELIKKYKAEFDHWLNEGKLWMKVSKEWKLYPNLDGRVDISWFQSYDPLIIIDDEYAEFRKALIEGKTVQYYVDGFTGWQDVTSFEQACPKPSNFRIKPEEPKFKVGDFVRYIHSNNNEVLKIENINCERYYFNKSRMSLREDEIEPWQPQPDEWCWFWNGENVPILGQYNYMNITRPDLGNPRYQVKHLLACFDYCEPFIGELPTYLKE